MGKMDIVWGLININMFFIIGDLNYSIVNENIIK